MTAKLMKDIQLYDAASVAFISKTFAMDPDVE